MTTNYMNSTNMNQIGKDSNLIFKDEVFRTIGAAIEVHKSLGCGFLEPVYQEALEIEFKTQHIPYTPQQLLHISYKGTVLEKTYVADFIAFEKIIVEIKAVDKINPGYLSQVLNYLKATGFRVGLLINFGSKSLEWKRLIH